MSGFLECPHCGEQFLAADAVDEPAESTTDEDEDERVRAEAAERLESELSGLRIRQLSVARRADIRSMSHCIVAAGLCAVACGQLVAMTVQFVRERGWRAEPVGYVLFAVAAFMGIVYFVRRAAGWARELRKPVLTDPETPPDLSALSDGSQRWRDLEDVR